MASTRELPISLLLSLLGKDKISSNSLLHLPWQLQQLLTCQKPSETPKNTRTATSPAPQYLPSSPTLKTTLPAGGNATQSVNKLNTPGGSTPEVIETVVSGPYNYLKACPGKNIRKQLIMAFNIWYSVPADRLEIITNVIDILHTASLLMDDVEDNSFLRRGIPVAHSIFGIPQTINSANHMYFCALKELRKLENPSATDIVVDELLQLHRGQGMDLYWRDSLICPTEEEYLQMVGNKTGGLFRLGIKLMQSESTKPEPPNCVPLVDLLGLIFQIRDDYQNLQSEEYTSKKGMCEDLTEGKFSFPIIHSIRHDPNNHQLLQILKQKTTDDEIKKYAIQYMESTGSFEYTRQVLGALVAEARVVTDKVEGKVKNQHIHKLLDKLAV
ncbi:geranylgeranyl pyrophosphate synthase [Pochonia chlamydosporia 170]|uniref:Geranylgeranyl pyrophosphate synthase n=1 Tax=Pochonia chlamydosporia 170 TaxID=1380566 RepID=A0A179F727_METCM|nr:geranylgeranyl pyrophosphate synthase [Pochonia chlamydosporia 170]OAQ61212.1 geranylgeranyl pyrophosphate synthase [Pochonia chlamydosporia 170]